MIEVEGKCDLRMTCGRLSEGIRFKVLKRIGAQRYGLPRRMRRLSFHCQVRFKNATMGGTLESQ